MYGLMVVGDGVDQSPVDDDDDDDDQRLRVTAVEVCDLGVTLCFPQPAQQSLREMNCNPDAPMSVLAQQTFFFFERQRAALFRSQSEIHKPLTRPSA